MPGLGTSQVGLGGGGALAISLEADQGVYQDPSTSGTVWVPIISEALRYTEERYYSPQLRQQTIVSDVKQGYYHAEGEIVMEVDCHFLPYFLYCSRHNVTKTTVGSLKSYKYVPSQAASVAGDATDATKSKTASITVIRNNQGFGYSGCVFGSFSFTIETGVLRCTMNALGNGEQEPLALGTPTWIAPDLFGADAHTIFLGDASLTPTWAENDLFNGFTFEANYNATAQNRIKRDRAATYISFGETESTYTTELDFIDRTEYDNFVATTQRAIKLESCNGGTSYDTATDSAVRITAYRSVYDTYDIGLAGMGDLIMAGVTGRNIGIAGGDAISFEVLSAADIGS